jgi:hypothetical protein
MEALAAIGLASNVIGFINLGTSYVASSKNTHPEPGLLRRSLRYSNALS